MAIPDSLKESYYNAITLKKIYTKDFSGSSPPSVFVSSSNYPKVTISPVAPPEIVNNALMLDSPEKWFGLTTEEVLQLRQQLVHSTRRIDVSDAKDPSYDLLRIQEVAMAVKDIVVDISLMKAPSTETFYSKYNAPMGAFAPMKSFDLTENPKIPNKVDYFVSDTDAKSEIAITSLYEKGLQVSNLYKLLSTGALGIGKNRKLVPTRFAITATDDILSKHLIEKIKDFQQLNEIQVFTSSYLDNNFFIFLIPGSWQFEMLESWFPEENSGQEKIINDFENYNGRKNYASQITGAYYSARLGVCEYLKKIKKQASVLVFREIGKEYTTPLGVWQIRENTRNAMKQKPLVFQDLKLALDFIGKNMVISMKQYKKKSRLLDSLMNQTRLSQWS